MPRKQSDAEIYFRKFFTKQHTLPDLDKARDKGYVNCPLCHSTIIFCPHCNQRMLLPKARWRPDYMVNWSPLAVEVKRSTKNDTWSLHDFSEDQEMFLNKHIAKGFDAWIFLLMGRGRLPNGKEAYLMPWLWLSLLRDHLEFKSVRLEATDRSEVPVARDIFQNWKLEWGKGVFVAPENHPWRQKYGEYT